MILCDVVLLVVEIIDVNEFKVGLIVVLGGWLLYFFFNFEDSEIYIGSLVLF